MRRRRVVVTGPGQVEVVGDELPEIQDGQLLLETVTSGVSAGTELAFVKGDAPQLHSGWDADLGLFLPTAPAAGYPILRLGYMEVARVLRSRTSGFADGGLVAAAYGHATAHLADPTREHVVPLPDDIDPLLGVFVAHFGPICANGLLHAAADATGGTVLGLGDGVRGRRVAITGGGAVGLMTGLLCLEHGAAETIVVEADPRRRAAAEQLGITALPAEGDPGRALKQRWRHASRDHGADVVFQCRGRSHALATALRAVRPQGTVIDLAFYTGPADDVRLGEEFHHNGLTVRCAQIGRVPRGLSSWDRLRLSAETIDLLRSRGPDIRRVMVSDVLPLDDAPALLTDLAARRRHVLTAVLTFPDLTARPASPVVTS
ncbi:MAG: zinc-dependent alcohol dehydrogenase [Angustibacter sp.]